MAIVRHGNEPAGQLDLKQRGILCIPEPLAFAAFSANATTELIGSLGEMELYRCSARTRPADHSFYALSCTAEPAALYRTLEAALELGVSHILHLGPARPLIPGIDAGRLVVVEAAVLEPRIEVATSPGLVRSLVHALGNHSLVGHPGRVVKLPAERAYLLAPAGDCLTYPLTVTVKQHNVQTGSLLVVDRAWPWQEGDEPHPARWSTLFPVFAELLGK